MNTVSKFAENSRSGEVVIRSMLSSQLACILTAITPQLVIILNGLIVSHFLGVDCFKAISVFNPISGMVLMLISTCCIGPSIQAGKAYGELNAPKANSLFSLSVLMAGVIGLVSAIVFFTFRSGVAEMMTSSHVLRGHLVAYIGPVSLYLLLNSAVCILNSFVTASGYVRKVTQAVISSSIINVVSIFILIQVFHLGVEAAGIAMCISAFTNIIVLLPQVLGRRFPFRLGQPDSSMTRLVRDNISVWLSVNSGSLSDGLFIFLINAVILHFLPSDGLFIWGVCQVAINIILFVCMGIDEAYFYVDAFLMGEGDNAGRLKIAKSLLLEISIAMVSLATVFTLFAEKFAVLFGADTPLLIEAAGIPLICIAWFAAIKNILLTLTVVLTQIC